MKPLDPHEEQLLHESRARRRFLHFCRWTSPHWLDGAHLTRIAELLEAVDRGEIKRLMINLPPRHGKSTTCSQLFPAWYLGRHEREQVIMVTHSESLSEVNGRGARRIIQSDRWPFASRISVDSKSATRWNLDTGAGMYSVGIQGSITGRGPNLLIFDDLEHDAGTDADRARAWHWYTEIATPRLEPDAAIIAIGTRFAEDDVFGSVRAGPDAQDWTVLRLPAIAEDEDPLGRAAGEALWEQRVPLRELESRKRTMLTRAFSCQFQQNPIPREGNLFKAEWLRRYAATPTHFTKVVCALDSAAKTGVRNDYSVIVKIGVRPEGFFVLDVWRDKVEFPGLVRRVQQLSHEDPAPSVLYAEDTSNATALIQALRAEAHLPIVAVQTKGLSKEARAESVTGAFEAGRVFLPEDAPWLVDTETELLGFPATKHDDAVDALVTALSKLTKRAFVYAAIIDDGGSGVAFEDDKRDIYRNDNGVPDGHVLDISTATTIGNMFSRGVY